MSDVKWWQKILRHKITLTIAAFAYVDMVYSSASGVNGLLINPLIDFLFK